MGKLLIQIAGNADGSFCSAQGLYLYYFDPNEYDGRGHVKFTANPKKAKKFSTHPEAMNFWQQQSVTKPLRDDGNPNRPLTAYSVLVCEEK